MGIYATKRGSAYPQAVSGNGGDYVCLGCARLCEFKYRGTRNLALAHCKDSKEEEAEQK